MYPQVRILQRISNATIKKRKTTTEESSMTRRIDVS